MLNFPGSWTPTTSHFSVELLKVIDVRLGGFGEIYRAVRNSHFTFEKVTFTTPKLIRRTYRLRHIRKSDRSILTLCLQQLCPLQWNVSLLISVLNIPLMIMKY
jgi:hypothetical protein